MLCGQILTADAQERTQNGSLGWAIIIRRGREGGRMAERWGEQRRGTLMDEEISWRVC